MHIVSRQSGTPLYDLGLMNTDGTNAHILIKNAVGGSWSPDGKRIAYVSLIRPGGVMVANADGTQPRGVTPTSTPHMLCRPVWSQDGKRLFFTRIPLRDGGVQATDICVVDADGKNFKRLTGDDSANQLGEGTAFFITLAQAAEKARKQKQ